MFITSRKNPVDTCRGLPRQESKKGEMLINKCVGNLTRKMFEYSKGTNLRKLPKVTGIVFYFRHSVCTRRMER